MSKKKFDSEDITMMAIQFCEQKGLLNQHMSLSTIEYIRHSKSAAVEHLTDLVTNYGNARDKNALKGLDLD